jgi:hypothetical protein
LCLSGFILQIKLEIWQVSGGFRIELKFG